MIEAPEALYLAGQLNRTVKGKTITSVFAQHTPHKFAWFHGKPEEYADRMTGKTIGPTRAQGGMIETDLGDDLLVLTDGVNLRYFAPGEKLPAKHQLLIGFEDESCLVASVRMYGGLFCWPKGKFDSPMLPYYEAARNKPQVMSEAFDKEYFMELIQDEKAQNKTAKAFLATGQTIPGLGNGVLQDMLYNARIHPKKKIGMFSDKQKKELYERVKETMHEVYRSGGRCTETDLFGVRGKYVPHLSKDTAGHECPRCGETIVKENFLGGSIYYCKGCQPI